MYNNHDVYDTRIIYDHYRSLYIINHYLQYNNNNYKYVFFKQMSK